MKYSGFSSAKSYKMKHWTILFILLISCFEMSSQDLTEIYPIVLPKPNEGFENRYFDILDNGIYMD
jgi:hypothetical protein